MPNQISFALNHFHIIIKYMMPNQMSFLPLKNIIHSPDKSGRLMKWAIELSEFDNSKP